MNFRLWLENEVIACGECFPFATKHATEIKADGIIPEDKIFVVHATVQPENYPRRYWHAWVETEERVHDWQMRHVTGQISMPRDQFYKEMNPQNIKKYGPREALQTMIKSGHHGPWHE